MIGADNRGKICREARGGGGGVIFFLLQVQLGIALAKTDPRRVIQTDRNLRGFTIMQGIRAHLGASATSLTLRASRNDILASNIANAATPKFKARDIDFKAEFERLEGVKGDLETTDPRHLPAIQPKGLSRLQYRVPINPSMDGNTVELPVEQMQFSENVLRYQASLSFINRSISGLTSAIKGE